MAGWVFRSLDQVLNHVLRTSDDSWWFLVESRSSSITLNGRTLGGTVNRLIKIQTLQRSHLKSFGFGHGSRKTFLWVCEGVWIRSHCKGHTNAEHGSWFYGNVLEETVAPIQ